MTTRPKLLPIAPHHTMPRTLFSKLDASAPLKPRPPIMHRPAIVVMQSKIRQRRRLSLALLSLAIACAILAVVAFHNLRQ